MTWMTAVCLIPLLLGAGLSVVLALVSWRLSRWPGSKAFAATGLAAIVWSLGEAAELAAVDLPSKLLWARIEYLGIVAMPVAWLAFAFYYGWYEMPRRRWIALLAVEPALTLLLLWTNDFHGLVWSRVWLEAGDPFVVLRLAYGPWFWLNVGYSYLLMFLATAMLARSIYETEGLASLQAGVLAFSPLIPWAANAAYMLRLGPQPYLDLTPFGFAATAIILAWARFRGRLLGLCLGLVPVARRALIDGMQDGVIALDGGGRVVDLNPAAQRLLGLSESAAIGMSAARLFGDGLSLPAAAVAGREWRGEISLGQGESLRDYDLLSSPLRGRLGGAVGQLLVFRDIADLKREQQALRESEESLRLYARRLETMQVIDRAILALRPPAEVARGAIARLISLVPCQQTCVTTFDRESRKGTTLVSFVEGRGYLTPSAWCSLAALVASFGADGDSPILQSDLLNDPIQTAHSRALLAEGVLAVGAVPLVTGGSTIGWLGLGASSPGAFTDQHLEIARDLADSLAVAIQNARLLEEAQLGRERLRGMASRLVEAQEAERGQLARELHDEIGQELTGLKLTLEMGSKAPTEMRGARLAEALALVNGLIRQVRDLSLDLRPAMLDDLGLIPALTWLVERYGALTGVRVSLEPSNAAERFAPAVETAAFRIVQEALTNVARHAGVDRAVVRLWIDGSVLNVQIQDRGRGFEPEAALASGVSRGLAGMRERAGLLGGQLNIVSGVGAGTLVSAELPLGEPATECMPGSGKRGAVVGKDHRRPGRRSSARSEGAEGAA